MPVLYVENVPDELYRGLRRRAREHRKSIAAEVISLLERDIPTAAELKQRQQFYKQMEKFRSHKVNARQSSTAIDEMIREDRGR
jgi:plasmid stability protein